MELSVVFCSILFLWQTTADMRSITILGEDILQFYKKQCLRFQSAAAVLAGRGRGPGKPRATLSFLPGGKALSAVLLAGPCRPSAGERGGGWTLFLSLTKVISASTGKTAAHLPQPPALDV